MACHSLGVMTESCMESDVEFGILPMPKVEESQESYYAGSGDNPVVIPITNNNMDRTGMIVEAMSAEGYRRVQPAYTETVMKERYATERIPLRCWISSSTTDCWQAAICMQQPTAASS